MRRHNVHQGTSSARAERYALLYANALIQDILKSSSQVMDARNGTKQERVWRDSAFLALDPLGIERRVGIWEMWNWKNSLDGDGTTAGRHG